VPNLLTIERIDAVGFVDEGANPESDILIWKRAEIPPEPSSKSPQMGDASMSFDINSLPDEAKAEFEALQTQVADLTETVATATAQTPDPVDPGEEILKRLPDETRDLIQKQLDDAESRVAKAEERVTKALKEAESERTERRMAEFTKQAEDELDELPEDAPSKATILYAVHENLDKDTAKSLMDMLRAANGVAKTANVITKQIGDSTGDPDPQTATAEMMKRAVELVASGSQPTKEQAVDFLLTTDKELATRVDAER